MKKKPKIAIVGLGYVGLPLALEFAKKFNVIGYDINSKRVTDLNLGIDLTMEVTEKQLNSVLCSKSKNVGLEITSNIEAVSQADIFIITVPTPIDENKKPDLAPLASATMDISKYVKKGSIIIYESTVYPGCTEEFCVPIIEKHSSLKFNKDFYCGYSPERINPGDKINTLTKIKKVTSGSTEEVGVYVDYLYKSIINAGTHLAPSIKVAEASKSIENAQRDLNISFINELALIFDRMNIDTHQVLEAAKTKWNFLPFKPGLVGGHCIGVDPYYLAHKAESLGYHPAVILSGRRVNDQMGTFVASKVVKLMIKKGIQIKDSKILILGITFKENCPDIRNTKVIDVINELKTYNSTVSVYDPWADKNNVKQKFNINLIKNPLENYYDSIILAVGHHDFNNLNLKKIKKTNSVVYDTKSFFSKELVDGQL
tara:strand:- start:23511 stop:24794 length:1284 start_codon:yes stop_codon:yes gene_type:complete